uniref:Uncharacterized protein n=1 Tax=Arundo donax TaxID=35708 RepID=A0A0A9B738_ARUDO
MNRICTWLYGHCLLSEALSSPSHGLKHFLLRHQVGICIFSFACSPLMISLVSALLNPEAGRPIHYLGFGKAALVGL